MAKKRRKKRFRPFRFIFTLLLLAVIVLVPLYFFGIIYPDGEEAGEYPNRQWMSEIDGSTPVSMINIPGTHDSTARYVFPAYAMQDQDTGILEQLNNGYRYFDLRVRIEGSGQYQKLVLCHNFADCRQSAYFLDTAISLSDVTIETRKFLSEYPSETVIFCIKPENEEDDPAVVQQLIENLVAKNNSLFYTVNKIPTLDSVRGKIILARRYEDVLELGDMKNGMNFMWEDQGSETVLSNPSVTIYMNTQDGVTVQDRYKYDLEAKWNAVQTVLGTCNASEHMFSLNFLSASVGRLPHPRGFAGKINERFMNTNLTPGNQYGIILFDFADNRLAQKVIDTNNKVQTSEEQPEG